MNLVEKDFRLFNREVVLFVKLKQQFDYDEIEWIKQQYKELWQKWKSLNLKAYEKSIRYIPYNKPKIESWTNGWQIRKHYWASYRMEGRESEATCIGVLLNRQNFRITIMWQKYKKNQSTVSASQYNRNLKQIGEWATKINQDNYFIWTTKSDEYDSYYSLSDYLTNSEIQATIKAEIDKGETFQIGYILKRQPEIKNVEEVVTEKLIELGELYQIFQ